MRARERRCELPAKLHQFPANGMGQKSPRAFKGLNETGIVQGGGILRTGNPAANCMHTPDRSIHERGRSQDEVTLLHPRPPLHPIVRNFRGDNAIGGHFIVSIIVKEKERERRKYKIYLSVGLLAARRFEVRRLEKTWRQREVNEF